MIEGARADPLASLPPAVRQRLDELKVGLALALGKDLMALLVHGSAVRGGYREGRSNVDVVLVVRDAAREKLAAIANVMQVARASARIEAMILQLDELAGASDVFPLLYDDIRRCNVVIAGEDPFPALPVDNRYQRLRIEQELRDAQIRLRRIVVDGGGNPDSAALARKVKQLRVPLHALLKLRGTDWPNSVEAVIAGAGRAYGVDVAPLARLREDPRAAFDALARLLRYAVTDADRLDPESPH